MSETRNRSPSRGKRLGGIRRGKIGRKHRERGRVSYSKKNRKGQQTRRKKKKKTRKQHKHKASVGVCTMIGREQRLLWNKHT